ETGIVRGGRSHRRIRRNCGTRDRREARRIQRECQERLLNGEYAASDGAITTMHVVESVASPTPIAGLQAAAESLHGPTWQECYQMYLEHRRLRVREVSLTEIVSRLGIAERILERRQLERDRREGLLMSEVATLDTLEDLQARLLAGEECRYERRSPTSVNTLIGAVMAFIRYCHGRGWVKTIPAIEKLEARQSMKGRPVTAEEFQRMLDATPKVVGERSAESWILALRILWESGFRVGDLMDFSWDDQRHIHPIWPEQSDRVPTLVIPATQKNGKIQEIPMPPGLRALLESIPKSSHHGWVVDPDGVECRGSGKASAMRPTRQQLARLTRRYSNSAIARACHVSEAAVRQWLKNARLVSCAGSQCCSTLSASALSELVAHAEVKPGESRSMKRGRMTSEHVSRVIARIGQQADVVVQNDDVRSGRRKKYASAHDLRRGLAERLINAGVSAETLKVVMRHKDFGTTEKHYGAHRSA
ncbi:MAG: tyrosine-type recombinase/integrase, partial [Planctomycetaceae bacterium]